jgi:hypothetical protein
LRLYAARVTTSDNGAVLTWTNVLTNVSIHTYTPSDDCGTVSASGSFTTLTLGNLNAGWGYSFSVSGTLNGSVVSGVVSANTTGTSPVGTTATQASLLTVVPPKPTKTITEVTTITPYTNGVAGKTVTFTTYSDGSVLSN